VNQLDIRLRNYPNTFVKYHYKERFGVYVCGRFQGGVKAFFPRGYYHKEL
jgi:hypothetical protein